jgi:hypothetical protein
MCTPMMIAGIALAGASSAANMASQRKVANEREDVLAAERIRQKRYDTEAQGLNTQSQDRFQGFEGQQAGKAQELGDYFQGATTGSPANDIAGQVMPSSSSDIVTQEIANQSGQADAFVNQQGGALASLRSFGDLLGDHSRMQARDASMIGQLGGFKRGSSAVVPYELEEANQAGSGMGMLGDILGGIGSIAGQAGGGMFGGAAPAVSGAAPGSFRAAQEVGLDQGLKLRGNLASLYPRQRMLGQF